MSSQQDGRASARAATKLDLDAILAFQMAMAQETEGRALDPQTVRAGVAAVFESPDKGSYVVAEMDGKVVGSVLVTFEWSDWRNAHFWWLQSVYVLPEYRRRGVLRALLTHVRDLAINRGDICGLRLYAEHSNAVAQKAYSSLGLSRSHYDMYELDLSESA